MSVWKSARAKRVLAALEKIGWQVKRQKGSHKTLEREGWADYVFAFHEGEEIGSKIDVKNCEKNRIKAGRFVNGSFVKCAWLDWRFPASFSLRAGFFQEAGSRFADLSVAEYYGEHFAARQYNLLRRLSVEFCKCGVDDNCFFRHFDD